MCVSVEVSSRQVANTTNNRCRLEAGYIRRVKGHVERWVVR